MTIRPLALLDLPYIYSFRDEAVGLDTARVLTRGNPLGAVGLLSYVNPSRHIYSAIADGEDDSVLGGIIHTPNDAFAKLYYLAPSSKLDHPYLPDLIENLSSQAGTWGRSMYSRKWMRQAMRLSHYASRALLSTRGKGCGTFLK